MKKKLLVLIVAVASLSSCQVNRRSMRESNYQIWLNKSDISYTDHVVGEANQTKVFGIDFERLFSRKFELGGINNLPADPVGGGLGSGTVSSSSSIVNGVMNTNIVSAFSNVVGLGGNISRVEQFAIHDLIVKNPGYDLVMFPQFEVRRKWFIIGSKTSVSVKARMAKITPEKQ